MSEYIAHSSEGSIKESALDGLRVAISARPRGVDSQVVGRVPAFVEQAHLWQPETVGDRGCEKVFRERCKIPIQDTVVRYPAKNPSEVRDLRGREFLGPRGLPTSSGSSRTLAEPLQHRELCIFDADPSMCRHTPHGISR